MMVEVQMASQSKDLPSEPELLGWCEPLQSLCDQDMEMVLRVVDLEEMIALNETYRAKSGPTNVLSFPFETMPGVELPLLGDVVICAPVVAQEALEQGKSNRDHWAHLVIHGGLHLLGYDHEVSEQAEEMESLEVHLLSQLGIADPYLEQLEQTRVHVHD